MKTIIQRITATALTRLARGGARTLALALALFAAGGAWAVYSNGTSVSWKSSDYISATSKIAGGSYHFTITLPVSDELPLGSVVQITEIKIGARQNYTYSESDFGTYIKINDVASDSISAFNGTMYVDTAQQTTLNVCDYKFDTNTLQLRVGTEYSVQPYNSSDTSMNIPTAAIQPLPSTHVMSLHTDTAYCCAYEVYGTVVSTTSTYESSPSGSSISLSSLSWTLDSASASLPSDLSSSILQITLEDGATLTIDQDVSTLNRLTILGSNATVVFNSSYTSSSTAWDFSSMTGMITLNDYPYTPTTANPVLSEGGVCFGGSSTLSTLPYASLAVADHVEIAQDVTITDSDGCYMTGNKGDYEFTGSNTYSFPRLVLGNQSGVTQTIKQTDGTMTVTGSTAPTSNSASVLLGHWNSTVNFYILGGTFNALNAASRLGWDGSCTWYIGGDSGTATVNIYGISTGNNGHTGAGTLNINAKGVLNLGAFGIQMASDVGAINLAGGTIVATADTTIANSSSTKTILNSSTTTTLNTDQYTITVSAPLSGSGALNKTGSGKLEITGACTATGTLTVSNGGVTLGESAAWGGAVTVASGTLTVPGETAQIAGNVTIGSGCTLAITGVWNVSRICSGTLTIDSSSTVTVNGTTITGYTVSSGMVLYDHGNTWSTSETSGKISENWVDTPTENDDASIRLSQSTTIDIDEAKSLGAVTVESSTDDAITLTLTGSETLTAKSFVVPKNVTLIASAANLSAPVTLSDTSSALEINATCTWASVISGSGTVKVSANAVTFSAANTFTGGLTVANGGLAQTTSGYGYGTQGGYITVESGGTLDMANANSGLYNLTIAGTGTDSQGAVICSSDISSGTAQLNSITLSANATVASDHTWGLLDSGYAATELALGTYTLTKIGSSSFWLCQTTISGSGSIVVSDGALALESTHGAGYTTTGSSATITVADGASLSLGSSADDLTISALTVNSGATVTVASGRTLTISSSLTSNGTITDNGTITCTGTITGTAQTINIGSSGLFTWQNVAWNSGDFFTGTGTLELKETSTSRNHNVTGVTFNGILKLTGSGKQMNFQPTSDSTFEGVTPELIVNSGATYLGTYYSDKVFAIRDLSGSGPFKAELTDASLNFTVQTKQTKDTLYSGAITASTRTYQRKFNLKVVGDGTDDIHTLTLSGANISENNDSGAASTLTISDNAKVIFTSSGKWLYGNVIVNEDGWLEATNTSAMTSLTLNDGAGFVVPYVNSATIPLTATTITLPESGTVYVDLSGVDVDDNTTVNILSATTLNNGAADLFEATSGAWRFAVSDQTITATKLGTLTCTDGTWSDDSYDGYTNATISITSTQTVTLPATLSLDAVAFTGSGTVTLDGDYTLSATDITIGSGVTLAASSAITLSSCTVSGDGELNVPTGITCTMTDVTCSAKVNVSGTLETHGATSLTSTSNIFQYNTGSAFNIVDGTTAVASQDTGYNGLAGIITISSGAVLTNMTTDALSYYREGVVVNVYGTLSMGSSRWTIGGDNTINLHGGAVVSGNQSANGCLDWFANATLNVYGDATISAPIRPRNTGTAVTVTMNVEDDYTLTLSGGWATTSSTGNINKTGTGTLRLKNMAMTRSISGSEGTVELYSNTYSSSSPWHWVHTATSTFSGKLKVTRDTSNYGNHALGSTDTDSTGGALILTGSPELEISGSSAYLCLNTQISGNYIMVRNLTATSGTIDGVYASGTMKTVRCLQTANSTYAGIFSGESASGRNACLYVYGEDDAEDVYALTLSGVSTTYGSLSVTNNARVVFTSTGSWANGTVTVGKEGWLASSNTAAVAATLTLGNGAYVERTSAGALTATTLTDLDESSTIYIAFGGDVTRTDGMSIISGTWATAPDAARFAFADTSLSGNWKFVTSTSGLTISKIIDEGVGYVSDGTAVVTNTTGTVTIPDSATAVATVLSVDSATLVTSLSTSAITIYATDSSGNKTSTTIDSQYFTFDSSTEGQYTITLNESAVKPAIPSGTVTVDETATEPVALASTGAPTFSIATIPGLWYGAKTSTDNANFYVEDDTITQATATGTTLTDAASAPDTVKYYQIAVGASKAALVAEEEE